MQSTLGSAGVSRDPRGILNGALEEENTESARLLVLEIYLGIS
jgi:hypothetical protein